MKKKNARILALAGILALVLVGGTFAYWTQTSSIENPFDTGNYGSTIVENFNPAEGEGWQPGVEVTKEVTAKNTGNTPLFVRAKLDETWTRKGEETPYVDSQAGASTLEASPVYTMNQVDPLDGSVAGDKSVVSKSFNTQDWVYNEADGWWYYKTQLIGNNSTTPWMQNVTLAPDADMGLMENKKYVSIYKAGTPEADLPENWIEYTGDMPKYVVNGELKTTNKIPETGEILPEYDANTWMPVLQNKNESAVAKGAEGYSNSNYNLKVTVQTVQSTLDAVIDSFGLTAAPNGTTWDLNQNQN